jgi:hypothetical protein
VSAAQAIAGSQETERSSMRSHYLTVLNWTFTAFNSIRILTYVPSIWAIVASGQSRQHSLLTWLSWLGANASMALWLYENNGRRCNKVIAASVGNAFMCAATCVVIVAYR